eukprot:Hpha_TRINITY_DN16848_c3_g1::TRINITY_DN16848_c3_g1_i3::g.153751::m.153751
MCAKAATLRERVARLPQEVPLQKLVRPEGSLVKVSSHLTAGAHLDKLPRLPVCTHPLEPWVESKVRFHTTCGTATKKDSKEERKRAALSALSKLTAPITCFTDGGATGGTENGGGGFVWELAGVRTGGHVPAGHHTSSYTAELVALRAGGCSILETTQGRPPDTDFALDSQSSVTGLSKGATAQRNYHEQQAWSVLRRFEAAGSCVSVSYIFGHVGIEGNEAADQEAGQGGKSDQSTTGIDQREAKKAIERKARQLWMESSSKDMTANKHPWPLASATGTGRWFKARKKLPRPVQAIVSQLRVNCSWLLGHYVRKWTKPGTEERCPRCEKRGEDNTTHLLTACESLARIRQETLGNAGMKALSESPYAVWRFANAVRNRGVVELALAAACISCVVKPESHRGIVEVALAAACTVCVVKPKIHPLRPPPPEQAGKQANKKH